MTRNWGLRMMVIFFPILIAIYTAPIIFLPDHIENAQHLLTLVLVVQGAGLLHWRSLPSGWDMDIRICPICSTNIRMKYYTWMRSIARCDFGEETREPCASGIVFPGLKRLPTDLWSVVVWPILSGRWYYRWYGYAILRQIRENLGSYLIEDRTGSHTNVWHQMH